MTSIHDTRSSSNTEHAGPRARPRRRSILPEADHQQLQRHLDLCEGVQYSARGLLGYVLRNKIMTTEPVANLHARDLVTGGCCVSYSVDGGPVQSGLLVHRARSGSGSGVIPVSSLLGATLIGMRIGQRAALLCEDGAILSVTVLEVAPPS